MYGDNFTKPKSKKFSQFEEADIISKVAFGVRLDGIIKAIE